MSQDLIAEQLIRNKASQMSEEQLVTFYIDNQLFGITILHVQDIVEPTLITRVPLAPLAIVGLLNLRGRIVTVVSIRACLNKDINCITGRNIGVTVNHKGDLYTLLVDRIGGVCSFFSEQLVDAPHSVSSELSALCTGIVKLEKELLVVLDVNKLLNETIIMATANKELSIQRENETFLS